jgi:DNA-binding HxlR family transcriptional regulator
MTDIIRKDVLARLADGDYSCEKEMTLAMFSGKWKLPIICHLDDGTYRFNDLRRLLPKITHKVLTNQLRELEQDHLITRTVEEGKQQKVYYAITPLGHSLMPIINGMYEWGKARIHEMQAQPEFSINESVTPRIPRTTD